MRDGHWRSSDHVHGRTYSAAAGKHSAVKVARYLPFVCSKTVQTGEEQQQNVGSADN